MKRVRKRSSRVRWGSGLALLGVGIWSAATGAALFGLVLTLAGLLWLPPVDRLLDHAPVVRREKDPFLRQLRQEGIVIALISVSSFGFAALILLGLVSAGSLAVVLFIAAGFLSWWAAEDALSISTDEIQARLRKRARSD